MSDLAGLREALIEECRRLGVCGLELRLAGRPDDVPPGEAQRLQWQAPEPAPQGHWSCTIPLTGARGALGELSLRCSPPALGPAGGAALQAVADEVARAVERILPGHSRAVRAS